MEKANKGQMKVRHYAEQSIDFYQLTLGGLERTHHFVLLPLYVYHGVLVHVLSLSHTHMHTINIYILL